MTRVVSIDILVVFDNFVLEGLQYFRAYFNEL